MFPKCLGFCGWKHTSSSQKQHPTLIHELCQQFSLTDLKKSTNNFHHTRLIGYSSFGKLYKGCLQHDDGSEYSVTIKPLYGEDNIEGNNQFNKEVELLCSYGYHPMQHFRDTIVTDKCDVFTFGMLLLEIVWGRRYFAMKEIDGFLEKPVEENIDMDIKGKIAPECWKVFIDIIQRCVNSAADERPTMGEVELQLEYALSLQEQADSTNIHGDYILLSKTIVNLKP
ncbi:hypothetical protein ACSQ67_023193 [Phaseolus vulgaris]